MFDRVESRGSDGLKWSDFLPMDDWLDGQLVDQVVDRMGLDSVKELDENMNYKTLVSMCHQ